MPTDLFVRNLDVIFFVYGLAFVAMGVAIFVHPRKESIFKLSDIIWLLAAFGLSHGINEWLDMFAIIKGYHSPAWNLTTTTVLLLSYVFLFEFSRRLIFLSFKHFFLTQGVAVAWYCFVFVLVFLSDDHVPSVWPRYFLGFPGGLFTALGLYFYYRRNESVLEPINVRRYFMMAAFCVGIYGILGGIVTPKAAFFPASFINTDSFLRVVGIPVQVFRAACALFLAWSIGKTLGIFDWEMEQKLKKEINARQLAEEKTKEVLDMKSEFVSMVSHELRVPLTAIRESISLVLEDFPGGSDTKQGELLKIASRNVDRLTRLINDVLDFQKLDSGKLRFYPEDHDINTVIKEARKTMLIVAQEKGLDIVLQLDDHLPKIKFDPDKITQVVLNLVNNSIKVTPQCSITISTSKGDNFIQVSVKDTGPGIKEEDMGKIFKHFEQLERRPGAGLGLVIAKRIIEAHKGKIWAESVFGQGATFHFVLPITEKRR